MLRRVGCSTSQRVMSGIDVQRIMASEQGVRQVQSVGASCSAIIKGVKVLRGAAQIRLVT
ncbi:hypothetical protein HC928_10555 [bacterium]|nr:hypothetical protein [bacterium]